MKVRYSLIKQLLSVANITAQERINQLHPTAASYRIKPH